MSIVGANIFLAIYRIVCQPDDRDVMTLTATSPDALDRKVKQMTAMSATSPLPFEMFKARLDYALKASSAAKALAIVWLGRTLEISGPWCYASGTFERGHFHGLIELVGPAFVMRQAIFSEMERMLRAAGCINVRLDERYSGRQM